MGPLSDAGFVIPRQTFVPRCHGGNFPRRAVKDEERGPLRPSILTGTSLHPADAKGLAAWLPPTQNCRRPLVLQRKSNAATVNLHPSSGAEPAIADTYWDTAGTDNTVSWLAMRLRLPVTAKCF